MITTFDLLVVGNDEASLCAAACAARKGSRVGVLRLESDAPSPSETSHGAVPNFVWRRLDLQEYDLSLEPVSARVTLMGDNQNVSTFASARHTGEALAENGIDDHRLWTSFVEDMARLHEASKLGAGANGVASFSSFMEDVRKLSAVGQLTGSCQDLLDDYFCDPKLKAHVTAHALAVAAGGGKELGSATMLPEFLNEFSWRVRVAKGARPLHSILVDICEKSGVSFVDGALVSVSSEGGKFKSVEVAGLEDTIKTRIVFFASPEAAMIAGVRAPVATMASGGNVTAIMRYKLNKPLSLPVADERAIFQIVDSAEELQAARDRAIDGHLPDHLPVEFEFADNGDLIARTHYCPKAFREEDNWREWTGQDRQAISARITQRIASRVSDINDAVSNSEITFIGLDEETDVAPVKATRDQIVIQAKRHNAISAAVKLVDKVLGYE